MSNIKVGDAVMLKNNVTTSTYRVKEVFENLIKVETARCINIETDEETFHPTDTLIKV